jgi:hypothetical protein
MIFSGLFKKDPNRLSKDKYWTKWEFFELLDDLHKAKEILSQYKGGYSGDILSAEEFHDLLADEIMSIEEMNNNDLSKLHIWFAPTSAWDDFVGMEGLELGNKIYERLDNWKKGNK